MAKNGQGEYMAPTVSGTWGTDVLVVCDRCGVTAAVDEYGVHDDHVVYVGAAGIGWRGSRFARGPHRCPDCASGSGTPVADGAAEPARLTVTVTDTGAATVVRVEGDVDLDVIGELRAALDDAVTRRPYVIVDLAVTGIDSLGIGTLVRARNVARRAGGDVVLAGPSPFVRTLLRTMRLDTAFQVYRTVPQAITVAHREAGQP